MEAVELVVLHLIKQLLDKVNAHVVAADIKHHTSIGHTRTVLNSYLGYPLVSHQLPEGLYRIPCGFGATSGDVDTICDTTFQSVCVVIQLVIQ